MAKNYLVKYYPVGNGDTSLITLKEGDSVKQTILVDCNIRVSSEGDTDASKFDVKEDLLKSILKRDKKPYIDIFVLSHGDHDHCRGFDKNFYTGDPQNYSDKNLINNEIIVDEMWFSPMIAEESTNEDEDKIQEEAERRLELHRNKHKDRNLAGNRIRIIGYDGSKSYADLDYLRTIPGQVIDTFNGVKNDCFSVFIHAPYQKQLKEEEKDKNRTSIVFQARFKTSTIEKGFACLAFFGGDSDHHAWKMIMDKTKRHKNDTTMQALDWDLFLAPHHCSWSFFNERPQEENPIANKEPLLMLDYRREGAKVISSSKKILKEKPNPPHQAAKEEYIKKVTSKNFIELAISPTEDKPLPVVFAIIDSTYKRIDSGGKLQNLRDMASGITAKILETSKDVKIAPKSENTVSHKDHRFHG